MLTNNLNASHVFCSVSRYSGYHCFMQDPWHQWGWSLDFGLHRAWCWFRCWLQNCEEVWQQGSHDQGNVKHQSGCDMRWREGLRPKGWWPDWRQMETSTKRKSTRTCQGSWGMEGTVEDGGHEGWCHQTNPWNSSAVSGPTQGLGSHSEAKGCFSLKWLWQGQTATCSNHDQGGDSWWVHWSSASTKCVAHLWREDRREPHMNTMLDVFFLFLGSFMGLLQICCFMFFWLFAWVACVAGAWVAWWFYNKDT